MSAQQTLGLSRMPTSLGLWGPELPSGWGQARQTTPSSCPWSLTPSRNLYNKAPQRSWTAPSSSCAPVTPASLPLPSERDLAVHLCFTRGRAAPPASALWNEPQCHPGRELKGKRSLPGTRRHLRPPSKCSAPSGFLRSARFCSEYLPNPQMFAFLLSEGALQGTHGCVSAC